MPRIGKGPTDRSASSFLKTCREALELSQKKLSQIIGVTQQQISKYERGESSIPRDVLEKVAALAGRIFGRFEQPLEPAEVGQSGLADKRQAPYTADALPKVPVRSGSLHAEAMMLDLSQLQAPSDRQRVRDLYERLLSQQEEK
jgi:transcriptional regulator with XRE-family HTH domain